jgi:hypothetical protein
MTRVLSRLDSFARPERALRGLLGVALVTIAWACADKVVGPAIVEPKGQIAVYADVGVSGVTTLVIQVSGPGIVKQDNSPDTLAFNVPLTNGVASGSLAVPAGAARVITARAFVGITESHRGSVTTNIAEGTNPTLHITLVPLVGTLPITVSIGSTIVVVRPLLASVGVNDTIRLTSEIRDHNGTLVSAKVRWATLNPNKASVDTNGLVTVRDTGDVQIVGTYGTVGGASKISGVAVASLAANHLTWNGSVNTNWSEPNNWTPHGLGAARVPSLTDSVVVPAGTPRMPRLDGCTDNNAARDIIVEQGATLTTSCYPLNVYHSAVIRGTVTTPVNLRPNATAAGKFQQLYIYGAGTSLADSVSADYVEVRIPIGTFALSGRKLRISGDLYVPDGTITMAAGDTMIVEANVNWSGDDQTGLLTGGVIFHRGNQFYGPRYYATGTSRLVLDRTATGSTALAGFDYLNNPNNSQINRLEIKSRDGAQACGHLRVTDTLSIVSTGTPATFSTCGGYYVRAIGPVITSANTDVATYLMDLRHVTGTSLVSGTWHPQITEFAVDDAVINATLGYQALRFSARNTLPANVAITDYLFLTGSSTELTLGGHKLTVGNYLETDGGATLKMTVAADSLIVEEYGYFPDDFHAAQKPKLTAGVISIGQYLYGFGFASAGTKLVMAGTSASGSKYISGLNYESRPAQELYDLEYAPGTFGVCERIRVTHNVLVKAGATLADSPCGGAFLTVAGDFVTEAGSSVSSYQVTLNTAVGTSHVAGAYSPQHTDFNVVNAVVKPGLAYGNIRFNASNQLVGATTATGYVYVNGNAVDLAINGQKLNVGNYLQLDNNSTLTMTNAADSVTVANYGYFNSNTSTVQEAKLTAGVLSIGEYLYGLGFNASGTHKVVFAGTSANTQRYMSGLNFESRATQGFQNLEIAAGKSYGICERTLVKGTLTVNAGATLDNGPCGAPYLRVDGDVISAATSVIAPYNVQLYTPFGTQHVDGTFSPDYTSLHTTVAAGQLKAGLGYKSVQFFAPAALGANMTVNGELNVSGAAAALTLNGQTLTVTGNLNVTSNGIIVMDNAADVLDVSGNVSWSSSGSEIGKLTNGTAIFRGATFCAQKYETSVAHKTIFQRGLSDPVRYQCVSSSSTAQLMYNVDVKGSGLLLECSMNVSHDFRVFAGAPVTMSTGCGSGTLYVGHDLIGDVGSTITNGTNYPSSSQLLVVLGDAIGTQHVSGAYSPHVTYFTALNAYIQPTAVTNQIDYKHVRIDQSTVFQDSTEIDGGLELINNAIVDLGGNTVVVKGSMDFNTTSRLRMVSSLDTLVVGYGDPAADLMWDGGDNSTDGINPLLTAGAVKFYGDRFYGLKYQPAVQGSPRHRFMFMSTASGTISLEGNPEFANLQVVGPRIIVNNSSLVQVKDSLIMAAGTTFGGSNQLQLYGDVVMASGADLGVATTYVDGVNGTSLVNGNFHPTTTLFRSATPAANAIKTGLAYGNVTIQNGQYSLNGTTAIAGNLDLNTSGRLVVNGQTLTVGGQLATASSGSLLMNQSTDAVTIAGLVQFNAGTSSTSLSGGTLTVGGNYNMFENTPATGTHRVVLTGAAAKTVNALNGTSRAFQNLDISGSGTVNLSSGVVVNGSLRVLTAVAVSGSNSDIGGNFETAVGSSFTHSSLDLSAAAGTSLVDGTLNVTTIGFATGSQTIKSGITYANLNIGGAATVSGGPLSSTGTITVNAGGSLSVPSVSTLNNVTINGVSGTPGTVSFLGSSLSLGTLTVNGFGVTEATVDLSPSVFVDFARIVVNTNGTLDNGDRSSGFGGFRYKTTGTPSGLVANGTFSSSLPGSQP